MPRNSESSLLVVVAHPDDECLGTGGTISVHARQGFPVDILCMTGSEERNSELEDACSILGARHVFTNIRDDFDIGLSMKDDVVEVILETAPTIVITHSEQDYNQNHVLCSKLVDQAVEWASHKTIFDNAHRVERILNMEINSMISFPNLIVNITEGYASARKALQQHRSQIGKADRYYEKLYDYRTRLRGLQGGCKRGEAFTVKMPLQTGPFYPENSVKTLL
ncbi:MAG: PIG-L family deacetylase [Candidatus Thorarchaeota archaeon]|nr:PIG-L family deacetylase [Candidatus Thorarchaeota archaeon]